MPAIDPNSDPTDTSMADLHAHPVANQQANALMNAGIDPVLLKHLHDTMSAPDPVMPQPGPQKPLSMWEAIAAALHPELLSQFKKDPTENPQFRGQLAAFQQAMMNKRDAADRLTSIANTGARTDSAEQIARERDALSLRNQDLTAAYREALLALGNRKVDVQENKPAAEPNWQIFTDRNGDVWQVDPKSGAKRKLDLQGKLPATETNTQSGLNAVQDTLDEMRALYETSIKQHGPAERNIQEGLQSIPIIRNVAGAFDPLAQQHEALRNKLVLQLNKPVSGQNRLLQAEITQLLKYVPAYGTDPRVAIPQFDSMQKMIDQFKQKYAAAPSGATRTGNPTLDHARAIADWIKGGKVGPRP